MIFPTFSAFDWSYISLIFRYLSLSHTIAKKFAKKRKHAEIDESFDKANDSMDIEEEIPKSQKKKSSKRKFMKPKDEWAQLAWLTTTNAQYGGQLPKGQGQENNWPELTITKPYCWKPWNRIYFTWIIHVWVVLRHIVQSDSKHHFCPGKLTLHNGGLSTWVWKFLSTLFQIFLRLVNSFCIELKWLAFVI